jgi:hypothetical protein
MPVMVGSEVASSLRGMPRPPKPLCGLLEDRTWAMIPQRGGRFSTAEGVLAMRVGRAGELTWGRCRMADGLEIGADCAGLALSVPVKLLMLSAIPDPLSLTALMFPKIPPSHSRAYPALPSKQFPAAPDAEGLT